MKDLFRDSQFFAEGQLFKEETRVVFVVDYCYLYNCLRHLSYQEYVKVRARAIAEAVSVKFVEDTEAAKSKFWERAIEKLEVTFGYQKPKSYTRAAEAMRKKRGGV